jgi:uncharacterized membrane protein YgcG
MTALAGPDWPAITAALQDQVDDLTATLEAQDRRITDLEERLARLEHPPPAGPR